MAGAACANCFSTTKISLSAQTQIGQEKENGSMRGGLAVLLVVTWN